MARSNRNRRDRQQEPQKEEVVIEEQETTPIEEVTEEPQVEIHSGLEETETDVETPAVEEVAEVPEELVKEVTEETKEPVKPEPKKEAKPVETKKEQPKVSTERHRLNLQDIQRLLKNKDLTLEEKLNKVAKEGQPEFKAIASALTGYNKYVGKDAKITGVKFVASKNQVLLSNIKRVLEYKGENAETKFKVMFDLINLGFLVYSKDSCNPLNLHRGGEYWNDKKELRTYNVLTIIISDLCSLATRQEKLAKIDLNKALAVKSVSLSEKAINRIKAYYKA